MKSSRFYVSGLVQGVGYRLFAARAAGRLGVRGYARNLEDGRVEVLAQGPDDSLLRFLDELRRGPRAGRVDAVQVIEAAGDPACDGFTIGD